MRVPWLADVLRDAGLDVYEDPGWIGRGKELRSVEGIVWHHTASSPRTSDTAVAAILRLGRRDLPGPLSQLGLERDGTWVCIADGRANHNGYGEWGNNAIGVEAYNSGVGEPWPTVQVDAYERGTAAILSRLGLSAVAVKGHKETDPGRKIDPAGIDMNATRERLTRILNDPSEEDDMPLNSADLEAIKKIVDTAVNRAIGGQMLDEASDQKADEAERKRDGSLKGWVVATAKKVGVTRADAIAEDPTHKS